MADWLDELASQLTQSGSDAIPSDPAAAAEFVPGKDSQSASDFFKTFFGDGATRETDADVPQETFTPAKDSQAANAQLGIAGAPIPSAKSPMTFLEGVLKNMNVKRTSDGSVDFSDPKTIDTLMKVVLGGGSIVNALMNKGQPQNYKSASQLAAEIKSPSWNWTPQQQASADAFFSKPMQGPNHQFMFASQMPTPIVPGRGYAAGGAVMGGNAMSQSSTTPFSSKSPSSVAYGMNGPLAATYGAEPMDHNWLGASGGSSVAAAPYTYQPGGPASVEGGFQNPMDIPGITSAPGQPNGVQGNGTTFTANPSLRANIDLGGFTMNDIRAMQADPTKAIGSPFQAGLVGGSINPGTGAPLHFNLQQYLANSGLTMSDLMQTRHAAMQAMWDANKAPQVGMAQGRGALGTAFSQDNPAATHGRGFAMGGPVMSASGMPQPAAPGASPLASTFPGAPTSAPAGSAGGLPIPYSPTMYDPGPAGSGAGGAGSPIMGGVTMYDPGPGGPVGSGGSMPIPPMAVYDPGPGGARPPFGQGNPGDGPNTQFAPRPGFGGPGGSPYSGGNRIPFGPTMHDPGPIPQFPPIPPKAPPYGNPGGPPQAPRMFARGGALGHVMAQSGGQDDVVPANLAGGEYVFDADSVSALGDGNNAAGAKKLDQFRENLRAHKRSAPTNKIPPKAKAPQAYMRGAK
jgi:hypothetical protein